MAKSKTRKRLAVAARRKKTAAYLSGGKKSKYALKHADQAAGRFAPTSPFEAGTPPPMPRPPEPRDKRVGRGQGGMLPRRAPPPLRPAAPPGGFTPRTQPTRLPPSRRFSQHVTLRPSAA